MSKKFSGQNLPTELTAKISGQQQVTLDAQGSGLLETLSLITYLAGRGAVPSGPFAFPSMLHFTSFLPPFREFGLLYPYIRDFECFFSGIKRHML